MCGEIAGTDCVYQTAEALVLSFNIIILYAFFIYILYLFCDEMPIILRNLKYKISNN